MHAGDFYVYVYIDPRNHEEFYFGKGQGTRKHAHISDPSKNEKTERIAAILAAGLKPIVRVIASRLTEHDALLIEKTLLWKSGRQLTNISAGHYSEYFRPQNTLHLELNGFDYERNLYYYNVGEGPHRSWDDYRQFGIISAGQGIRWRDAMLGFHEGDLFAAYLKNCGFVGIGQIIEQARPIRDIKVGGKPLLSLPLRRPRMADNVESDELCEYVAKVKWVVAVDRQEARWQRNSGLYTTTHVRASLDRQRATIAFLEREFSVNLREWIL